MQLDSQQARCNFEYPGPVTETRNIAQITTLFLDEYIPRPDRRPFCLSLHGEHDEIIAAMCICSPKKWDTERDYMKSINNFRIFGNYDTDYCFEKLWNALTQTHSISSVLIYPQYFPMSLSDSMMEQLNIRQHPSNSSALVYFPFGVIYKVTDMNTGEYYIGQTQCQQRWDKGYRGSGTLWREHLRTYPDHMYKREILMSGFDTPGQMHDAELVEIMSALDLSDERTRDMLGKWLDNRSANENVEQRSRDNGFLFDMNCLNIATWRQVEERYGKSIIVS